jgi:hypothetical protein
VNIYTLQGQEYLLHEGNLYVKVNPNEQPQQNGQKSARLCGLCHEPGHRKENCPQNATSTS